MVPIHLPVGMRMTALFLLLVAAMICAADSASTGNKRRLSHDVLHYEPLSLGNAVMASHQSRSRRSAADSPDAVIPLEFEAYGRAFRVKLQPNTELVRPTARVTVHSEDGTQEMPIDLSIVFKGSIEGQTNSAVYATVVESGDVVATLRDTEGEMYYIEPSHRYLREEAHDFDHVIYRLSDADLSAFDLASEAKAMRKLEERMMSTGQPAREQRDQATTSKPRSFHEAAGLRPAKMRRTVGPAMYCGLHVVADVDFYNEYKGSPASIARVTTKILNLFNAEQAIYNNPQNQLIDPNIVNFGGFQIEQFTVYKAATGVFANTPADESDEDYLARFSKIDLSNHCLGTLFTHRDFSGTIGLAYMADPKAAGGMGWPRTEEGLSQNSAWVTTVSYGNAMSAAVSQITLAHEHAHNLGSDHDESADCIPGNLDDNYIMYPVASAGDKANNWLFSSCSKKSISIVLAERSSVLKVKSPTCGNRIVEAGEQCDCGSLSVSECQAYDPCCNPGCTLKSGAMCSTFATPCCTASCVNPGRSDIVCSVSVDGCKTDGVCDINVPNGCGVQYNRAAGTQCDCKEDGTNCNGLCSSSGVCSRSRCEPRLGYNGEECISSDPKDSCTLYCLNAAGTECVKFTDGTTATPVYRSPNDVCYLPQEVLGYCDGSGHCRKANTDDTPDPESNSGPNVGAIVGGVLGGLASVVTVIVAIVVCRRKKASRASSRSEDEYEMFE
ncbi:hypothetical protein CAOG_07524 [Capsaspora owczarzaki ATCC 30864]|uniref:Uncharacterized protein n=1 Tax=Capsaspora owczarzaki (strain ATCC 30864) TaxID=595528 RepID=A0A0D2WWS6_CAPO3|nr:hypothetical protein CAOG_07524 [Capsaspora owczarzaki ATCC 30864]KJE97038.1 hypothetical protein CAOG_007524 [Capsaspora owczarzaki ATCC 30864]|eukprot:XP_004343398.1 hypothetical protein CAOG_07524 [Capsaspora owczarzaki ATCC 30864]